MRVKAREASLPGKRFALKLDVLRGIAAILMIVSHAEDRRLSPSNTAHIAALLLTIAALAAATLMSAPQALMALAIMVAIALLAVAGVLGLRGPRAVSSP